MLTELRVLVGPLQLLQVDLARLQGLLGVGCVRNQALQLQALLFLLGLSVFFIENLALS